MTQWVIAEWIDEGEERVRAPSYQSANGKWYRAGVSDYGGPTILLMEGDPVDVTRIQGSSPQRRPANYDLDGAIRGVQVRQAAIGDSVANLAVMVSTSLARIERDLARALGRPSPNYAALPNTGDTWFGAPMSQPVLSPPRSAILADDLICTSQNSVTAGSLESEIAKAV
jgi:hypothetical protein